MLRGKQLQDYVGKNEKTKIVVKLQKIGQGAPQREPVMSEEERKAMMLHAYRRQEELKVGLCHSLFVTFIFTCFAFLGVLFIALLLNDVFNKMTLFNIFLVSLLTVIAFSNVRSSKYIIPFIKIKKITYY